MGEDLRRAVRNREELAVQLTLIPGFHIWNLIFVMYQQLITSAVTALMICSIQYFLGNTLRAPTMLLSC